MPIRLFYSWQLDRPSRTGRNLIERALERAIGIIQGDIEVDEAVRDLQIDRDTKDVPGSPPIVDTIFAKIDAASIFLPDLTFVGSRHNRRPTSNPNVLIEYGWALKALGHGRIICVMNTAHGEPSAETLPFDMQHLRHPITYHCPDDADEKTRRDARDGLAKTLAHAIRLILDSPEMLASRPSPPTPPIFPRLEEKDGPGRFRAPGEPLGVVDGHRGFSKTILDLGLSTGAPAWLRLIPSIDPGRRWKWAELKQAGSQAIPLYNRSSAFNYLRAVDGFGMFSVAGSEAVTDSVTMVFDTGEIWSVDCGTIDAARDDYLPLEEREFVQALQRLTDVARKLGLPGPFRLVAGMAGVRGRSVASPSGYEVIGTSVVDLIVHESDHAYGVEPAASLEPFFEIVFDRCGVDRADWLKARKATGRQPEITVSYSVAAP